MGRFFKGLGWIITLRWIQFRWMPPDANMPLDFTKDEKKLKTSLDQLEKDLATLQQEKTKVETELQKFGQQVREGAKQGKVRQIQVLFNIKSKQDELAILSARETLLCRKVRAAKTHLAMIALHNDSKPLEVREEVKTISARLRVRITQIEEAQDESEVTANEMGEAIDINVLYDELDEIEKAILQDDKTTKQAEALVEKLDAAAAKEVVGQQTVRMPLEQERERIDRVCTPPPPDDDDDEPPSQAVTRAAEPA